MRWCLALLTGCIALAQGVSSQRPTPAPEFPRRVILDTDPGIDDAMAVLLALRSPELKIEAITTVFGNVPVDLGTENARKLVDLSGRTDIVVAMGASRPMQRQLHTAELIHGQNGLGGVELPAAKTKLDPRPAVQVIRDAIVANPGKVTLVPVGPLTNIAMAFLQYPELAGKTREIILMGGTVGAGNVTPVAEANIYADAEAAKIVFESGVPILMVDMTACAQARMTRAFAAKFDVSPDPVAKFVGAIAKPYLAFSEQFEPGAAAAIYDALAVGIAIDPAVAKSVKPVHVAIETKGEFTYGATVTNQSLTTEQSEFRDGRYRIVGFPSVAPNAAFPAQVDGERFLRLFQERMTNAAPRKAAQSAPVERALRYLSAEVPQWRTSNGCFSCHNNGDGARALYAAGMLDAAGSTTEWLLSPSEWGKGKVEGGSSDKTLALYQFAAALTSAVESGAMQDRRALHEAAQQLAVVQMGNGAWRVEDEGEAPGSPVTWGTTLATYFGRRSLMAAGGHEAAVIRAETYLRSVEPRHTPDEAAILLALPKDPVVKKRAVDRFTRMQTSDGGWGPRQGAPAEVFDTALVLLALRASEQPALISRGRAFLIRTQQSAGGWPETTRPSGSQSYAQHISTTAWATLALLATENL